MRPILVVLLLAAVVAAQEPTRLSLPAEGPPPAETMWYGVYADGVKVGWLKGTVGLTPDGELIEAVEFHAKLAMMGQEVDFRMRQRTVYDEAAPYAVARSDFEMTAGPTRQTIELRRGENGYRAVVRSPGGEQTLEAETLDLTFEDIWTPATWFAEERAGGDVLTVRSLDLERLAVDTHTYRVDKVTEAIVQGIPTKTYVGRLTSARQGDLGIWTATPTAGLVQITFGGMFEARLEDENVAKDVQRSADLFVRGAVRVDRPLGDPVKVKSLVLEVRGEAASRVVSGPRQSVVEGEGGVRILRLGAAHGAKTDPSQAEIDEAKEATLEYPAEDERIVALAREAVGDAASEREKAEKLVAFVSAYVEDALVPEAGSAIDVAAAKKGDCSEHATLLTALGRAAGIPTRTVFGLMYMGDEVRAFGGHAWNEMFVDGAWLPVDATWDQVGVDATHVGFGHGKKGATNHTWTLGKLKFRVVSVEHAE